MKFLSSLTTSLKDAIGVDKRISWNEGELSWFRNVGPELRELKTKVDERFEPFYKKAGEPLISRSEFTRVCETILVEDFNLPREDLKYVDFNAVFETHSKGQGDGIKDNLRAICTVRCILAPFKEPSNFLYWFALCDTNRSGGLDAHEFRKLLEEKFRGANQGKVQSLTDQFFPDDQDNLMVNFWRKISRKEEVTLLDYIRMFPQDFFQECTCSEIMKRCK